MTITSTSFPEIIKEPEKEDAVADSRFYPSPHKRIESNKVARVIKRCIDMAGSLVAILLFSPLFIIIPIIIKFTSKGPVFSCRSAWAREAGCSPFKIQVHARPERLLRP